MKSDYKNRVPEGPSRWGKNLGKITVETTNYIWIRDETNMMYSTGAEINYHLNVKAF